MAVQYNGQSIPVRARLKAMLKGWQFGGTGASTDMGDAWLRGVYDFNSQSSGPMKADFKDLQHSAIVMACVQWVMRTFPEAPLQVKQKPRNVGKPVENHKLVTLLEYPNPYYSGLTLWQSTVASYNLDGNAYWIKVRNGSAQVLELWYEPHTTMRPCGNPDEFISHYEIYRNGFWHRIPREDVVHFRFGQDDENPRKGLSPLKAALRDVFTDNEAGIYTASLLKNMGIPGVVISPEKGDVIGDPDRIKDLYMQKFTGPRRGEPLIWGDPLKVDMLSFSPENMNLRELRKIPQENVSGLLGVAAIVAGLGAGLDRSTFANMAEAREYSYEGNIIPTGSVFGATLDTHLLPDFGNREREYCCFDYSNVRVLQEDQNALAERLALLWDSDLAMRSEVRATLNMEVDEGRDAAFKSDIAPPPPPPSFGAEGDEAEGDDQASDDDDADTAADNEAGKKAVSSLIETKEYSRKLAAIEKQLARRMEQYLSNGYEDIAGAAGALEKYAWDTFGKGMWDIVKPKLVDIYALSYQEANRLLPVDVAFDVSNPAVQKALKSREPLIKGVSDTVKDIITNLVADGTERGQSVQDIAKRIREAGATDSKWKSLQLARTESATGYNLGATMAYEDAGVTKVEVLDSDDDEDCAAANGQVWTLEEARANPIAHPNCVRAFAPVIDD